MPRHGFDVVLISQSSSVPVAATRSPSGVARCRSVALGVEQQARRRDAVLAAHPIRDHGLALASVVGEAAAAEPAAPRAVQLLPPRPARMRGRELRGIRRRDAPRTGPQPRHPVARVGHDAPLVRMRRLPQGRRDARCDRLEVEQREGGVGHPTTVPPTSPSGRSPADARRLLDRADESAEDAAIIDSMFAGGEGSGGSPASSHRGPRHPRRSATG